MVRGLNRGESLAAHIALWEFGCYILDGVNYIIANPATAYYKAVIRSV